MSGLVLTVIFLAAGLSSASTSQAASATLPYYLSLGDSYSIGYQPGIGGTDGFTGYIAGKLQMQAEKFGCGGATTTSMLGSNGCTDPASQNAVPYSNTQEQAALGFIAAHPGVVSLITMSIGGNDFDGCSTAPCVEAAMPVMEANIKSMVSALSTALASASDVNARIIGLTYPDVELGFYVYPTNPPSAANVTSAQSSVLAFDDLINPTLSESYASVPIGSFVDVTSAPFGNATQGDDTPLSSTEQVAPYGSQPDAVGEICQLTYFCSLGNIHANTSGYTFIGQLAVAHYESLFDVTPPVSAMLVPSGGAALKGTTYLDAAATDNVGVTKVQFVLTGGTLNHSVLGTAVPTLYGYVYQFNSTSVPDGSYTLQSVAYDAGNTGSSAGVTISVGN
jgi:GDSL-like Lipase/Acylhydrolase family/Bacterial Ig domain